MVNTIYYITIDDVEFKCVVYSTFASIGIDIYDYVSDVIVGTVNIDHKTKTGLVVFGVINIDVSYESMSHKKPYDIANHYVHYYYANIVGRIAS